MNDRILSAEDKRALDLALKLAFNKTAAELAAEGIELLPDEVAEGISIGRELLAGGMDEKALADAASAVEADIARDSARE